MSEKNFQKSSKLEKSEYITGNPLSQKGFKARKNINDMRVRLEKPVLDEFFKLVTSSENFVNWKNLSEKLSYSRCSLRDIRLHGRTFPRQVFEELLQFIEPNKHDYFQSNAKYLHAFWNVKKRWDEKLTKIRKRLAQKNTQYYLDLRARLCGYLAGDGSISKRRNGNLKTFRYDIAFYPDDLEMAESINEAFHALYDRKFNILKDKTCNNYNLKGNHKVAYFDLMKIGKFGTHEWRVPFDFLRTDSMKSEWLRGFYDSEAYVGKRKIQIQSVNKEGIRDVKKLLESLGVETSKIYKYERKQKNWNTNFLLEIRRENNLKRYLKLVGFNHSSKKAKLESQLAGVAESG